MLNKWFHCSIIVKDVTSILFLCILTEFAAYSHLPRWLKHKYAVFLNFSLVAPKVCDGEVHSESYGQHGLSHHVLCSRDGLYLSSTAAFFIHCLISSPKILSDVCRSFACVLAQYIVAFPSVCWAFPFSKVVENINNLHCTDDQVYNNHTAAKSVVGFSRPKDYTGAQAPSVQLGAFFVPEGSSFGSAYWEVFGPAGCLCLRSANPMRAAAIFFSRKWCQLFLIQTQEDIMDHSIFTLREGVTPAQLSNFLYENAIQAEAINHVLSEHLSNRSELSEQTHYEETSKLQWALSSLLKQQRVISDKLVMLRITQGEFKAGELV